MEIKEWIYTGWPSQVEGTLRRSIAAHVRDGVRFRIGISNDPYRRARQHPYNAGDYGEMVILYYTSSDRLVRNLETELIRYFGERCDNERGGGGGARGEAPYYLYIVK